MSGDFLRNSGYGGRSELRDIIDLAEDNLGMDRDGYREDFVDMLYNSRNMR
jgi:hypothetical protein